MRHIFRETLRPLRPTKGRASADHKKHGRKLTGRTVSSVRPMVTTERDAPSAAARTPRLAARARERPAAAVLRLAARSDMVALEMEDRRRRSPTNGTGPSTGEIRGETCPKPRLPLHALYATSFDTKVQHQDEDLGIDYAGGSRRSRGHPNGICVHAVAGSYSPAVICVVNF